MSFVIEEKPFALPSQNFRQYLYKIFVALAVLLQIFIDTILSAAKVLAASH